jgi:cytochrome c
MRNTATALAGVIAASVLLFSTAAAAQSGDEVLKTKGCLNCHDMEKKKVGPAFKEVAAKKAGKADELVAKIKDAKGHPKVNASEAEIKAAVDKVLSTK